MTTTSSTTSDYTQETIELNGIEVTVYGGTKHPVLSYSLNGHHTGWLKRSGARVTYAELTCVCHLVGERHGDRDEHGEWIAYGSEGWVDRLNALALAHIENVTARGFMIRAAGGDRDRRADRIRANEAELRAALADTELDADVVVATLTGPDSPVSGITAADGTRFELASDRSRFTREPLPIS